MRQSEGAVGRGSRRGQTGEAGGWAVGDLLGSNFRIHLCMSNVALRVPPDVGVMEVTKNII
jgi:hypothetical protein